MAKKKQPEEVNLWTKFETVSRVSHVTRTVNIGDHWLSIEIHNANDMPHWQMALTDKNDNIHAVCFLKTEQECLDAIPNFMQLAYPMWRDGKTRYPDMAHITVGDDGEMKLEVVDRFHNPALEGL